MYVASLELCKELYELSGWSDTRDRYYEVDDRIVPFARKDFQAYEYTNKKSGLAPAYDLCYLMRKLPPDSNIATDGDNFVATHFDDNLRLHYKHATTPEDAVAKLAIELFKQGVLTKAAA